MIDKYDRYEEIPQIAARLVTSVSTVKRTLDHARSNNGELRVPQQGKGKTDDPRWIFAGPRGPGNVYHLKCTMDASEARRELRLVHEQVNDEMEEFPAYSTMIPCSLLASCSSIQKSILAEVRRLSFAARIASFASSAKLLCWRL